MKTPFLILITSLLCSCSIEKSELEGIWDATDYVRYPSDTISIEDDLESNIQRTTVKTDSGIYVVSHLNDSILDISLSKKLRVIQFHFDDKNHGVLSNYKRISELLDQTEDPRYTANNYNFSTRTSNGQTYLLIDYHFGQFGRAIDTVEYQLISANELLIAKDTLRRINEP